MTSTRTDVLALGNADHQLGGLGRQRTALGDPITPGPGFIEGLARLDDAVDDAKRQRVGSQQDLAAQRHAPHHLRAEAPHGALGARPARHHADRGLGEAKLDLGFRDTEIAGGGQFQPAAQRVAGEDRYRWLAQPGQPVENAMAVAHPLHLEIRGAHGAPGLDVAAGAKSLAFATNEHDARAVSQLRLVERSFQRAQHGDVQRVEFLRPPQRDDADGAVLLEAHQAFSHARLPARRRH